MADPSTTISPGAPRCRTSASAASISAFGLLAPASRFVHPGQMQIRPRQQHGGGRLN